MGIGIYRNTKFLIIGFIIILTGCTYIFHKHRKPLDPNYRVMIWWTPYESNLEYHRKCGQLECRFTSDRKAASEPNFKGYFFYGTKLSIRDLPYRRKEDVWSLYHDSSPKMAPFLLHALDLFNFTATFSRYSDVPLTLEHITSLEDLINYKLMYSYGEKTAFQHNMKLAPILYIQSRCDTLTGRELYVAELGKHIPIDSYGSCLNNKSFPNGITDKSQDASEIKKFYDFVSRYKFLIVYQDLVCDDYISGNLWKSLTFGVVPIYFGATNIKNYLPNPNSAILINDFHSPAELARYIWKVSNNEDEYVSFLKHKTVDFLPIQNQLLVDIVYKNDINYVKNRVERSLAEFECYVCVKCFEGQMKQAKQKELSCDVPFYPPGNVTYKAESRVFDFLQRSRDESNLLRKSVIDL
ncbi:alpha-(1,3)-fucosyltransferase 10 [Sabethes cyaneus]|uniref:alpha-(1,3)-fucosyltransferase 10 n=1 Tax=Sabethes cyaneus TaxID=53552 RepID=UPI00237DD6BD|nr:alpha-(1,3)-fucosyltransferase 10 [Sabethes cyaneus]